MLNTWRDAATYLIEALLHLLLLQQRFANSDGESREYAMIAYYRDHTEARFEFCWIDIGVGSTDLLAFSPSLTSRHLT